MADVFAFMHWVGDEDRGLTDIMLVNGQFVLIDNGLCGPGPDDRLRGYHPDAGVFSTDQILKKCYPGKPSLVAFVLRDAKLPREQFECPPVLRRIADLSDQDVIDICQTAKVGSQVADVLNTRRLTLNDDYRGWLASASSLFAT
jgi:hypothetical protein